MGVYIYSLRKPVLEIRHGIEVYTACALRFLRKPHWDLGDIDKRSKMLTAAASARFDTMPQLAIVSGDALADGDEVLKWKGKAWCFDEPRFPGYTVGKLRIMGRGKHCVYQLEPCDDTWMSIHMLERGMRFHFGKVGMQVFNKHEISGAHIPAVSQKGSNSQFTEEHLWTMGDGYFYMPGHPYRFRMHDLPMHADWSVRVILQPESVDNTNELEAIYS